MTKEIFYKKLSTVLNPENEGYYHTDKVGLYYKHDRNGFWTTHENRNSEEYPKFWFEPQECKIESLKDEMKQNAIELLIYIKENKISQYADGKFYQSYSTEHTNKLIMVANNEKEMSDLFDNHKQKKA